ncbi:MAG: Gfo/Idh/MocA family oxidoreductase [Candidatus Poribacteria bacterium]|nr:Gfo/Idh/MocA family oxidoreductase [Candidatus Poribacteria bacterium]
MKKLKAVVVGAGWSAEGHTKAFQHYGVEVLAICARKPDIVQKVASRLGVTEASTDWRKSLLKHKPDIVALTTPAILRTEVIELAVDLGCHIISEKPLALTAEEAGDIYNLIKDTGLKHGFAATHLYDPSVAYMRQLLTQEKVIGELKEVDIGYTRRISNGTTSEMVKPWNWMNSLAHGGGILNNGLTHRLGMLERMTGMKVVSAIGEAKAVIREALSCRKSATFECGPVRNSRSKRHPNLRRAYAMRRTIFRHFFRWRRTPLNRRSLHEKSW